MSTRAGSEAGRDSSERRVSTVPSSQSSSSKIFPTTLFVKALTICRNQQENSQRNIRNLPQYAVVRVSIHLSGLLYDTDSQNRDSIPTPR